MKRFILFIFSVLCMTSVYGQESDTLRYDIDEVIISSIYHSPIENGSSVAHEDLVKGNYGQDPSSLFKKMPSIIE